jgi:hypothetical protein
VSQQVVRRDLALAPSFPRLRAPSLASLWDRIAATAGAPWRARRERAAIARFAAEIDALDLDAAIPAPVQTRILEAVATVAGSIDLERCPAAAVGYGRRLLHDDPAGRWSLAAIVLCPGQSTPPHDHGGWGCAVTVTGIERDHRFSVGPGGRLTLTETRDYPPGSGYVFDPTDIHQPVGAAQDRVTVALHFLLHGHHHDQPQRHHEGEMRNDASGA